MNVTVKLFAAARDLAGQEVISVPLAPGATIGVLRQRLEAECPALAPLLRHTLFAIDAEYASDTDPVDDGAEVACIPPVSGG